jgi:tryptophan-rich sensory protein
MSFLRYALFTVPAVVLLGTLSGRLSGSGYGNAWFDALAKPAFMPPGWVFGVAWTFIYILIGLSLAMVFHAHGAKWRERALMLFALQLLLNFAWSPLFFAFHKVEAALSLIAAMIVVLVATIFVTWRFRPLAALLLYPYLAWLMFALALNYRIAELNPGAERLVPAASSIDIPL